VYHRITIFKVLQLTSVVLRNTNFKVISIRGVRVLKSRIRGQGSLSVLKKVVDSSMRTGKYQGLMSWL